MECSNKSFSELAKEAASLLALSAEVSSPTMVHRDFPVTTEEEGKKSPTTATTAPTTVAGLEPPAVVVSDAAGNVDPSFARPARLERDIALAYKATRAMRELLRLAASDPARRPENWPADGDAIYLNREISPLLCAADPHVDSMIVRPSVLRDPEQMKQLSMVLFVAARRPPESDYQGRPDDARDAVGLWDLERDILKHLVSHKSIHLYVVVPLPGDDRNYANLVLARPLKADEAPIGVMDACTAHATTVSKTAPRAYRWVNIHSGAAHNADFAVGGDDENTREPSGRFHFTRTKCIDYGDEMPPPLPAPCLPFKTKAILPRSDLFPAFQRLRHGAPTVGAPVAEADVGYEAYAAMSHAESGGDDDCSHKIDGLDVNRAAPLPLPSQLIAACYGETATRPLRFTSCMGHNSQAFYREVVLPHLAQRTGLRIEWVEPEPLWQRGPWRALTGCDGQPDAVDVVAMCGVEFGRGYFAGEASRAAGCGALLQDSALQCQPLAAPVVNFGPLDRIGFTAHASKAAVAAAPAHFATEDVTEHDGTESAGWYTSVLVTRRRPAGGGAARPTLAELKGTRFAVNEAASWSGCMLMRLLLSQLEGTASEGTTQEALKANHAGQSWPELDRFFGDVVPSGSHMASLNMVLAGDADCALIDAAVLTAEMCLDPARAAEVAAGVVAADVPELATARWPMPPIVASRERLCPYARGALQRALVELASRDGAPLSPGHSLSRFVAVGAAPYRVLAAAYEALSASN